MTISDAEIKQKEFDAKLNALGGYSPRNLNYIEAKNKILVNAKNFYEKSKRIIEGFNKVIFLLKSDDESLKTPTKAPVKEFNELIIKKEKDIDKKIFKKYLGFQTPSILLNLYNLNDEAKKNDLVKVIKSGLKDLKKEIKEMFKEEREIEKPDKIVDIVEEVLKFNEQQEGKGLKILTPNQMVCRLPISLAKLQAGNNSQKLKNEIRQLLYSLYRSKILTKQVYNNLIKCI